MTPEEAAERLHAAPYAQTVALVVVRDGGTVFEDGDALDEPADVYSVTKSVLSTVAALGVRDGLLDLDETLTGLLGRDAHHDPSIRHLLEMTGGAHADDPMGDIDAVMELPSAWVDRLLLRPQGTEPGTVFSYDNGSAHELSAALSARLGPVDEFAGRHVFEPLGIEGWHWMRDPEGVPWGGSGLRLSPRQLAVLGEAWRTDALGLGELLAEATTARSPGGIPEDRPYGRMFWIDEVAGGPAFFAGGYAGQHVLVVPHRRLTLVTTGDERRLVPGWRAGLEVTRELAKSL